MSDFPCLHKAVGLSVLFHFLTSMLYWKSEQYNNVKV